MGSSVGVRVGVVPAPKQGERARTALRVLETVTYSCANPDDLHEITSKIEEIIVTLKGKLRDSFYDQKLERKQERELKKSAGNTGLF